MSASVKSESSMDPVNDANGANGTNSTNSANSTNSTNIANGTSEANKQNQAPVPITINIQSYVSERRYPLGYLTYMFSASKIPLEKIKHFLIPGLDIGSQINNATQLQYSSHTIKELKNILNKLAEENFVKMTNEIKKLPIATPQDFDDIAKEFFESAKEAKTNMKRINQYIDLIDVIANVSTTDPESKKSIVLGLQFLKKCKAEFKEQCSNPDFSKMDQTDAYILKQTEAFVIINIICSLYFNHTKITSRLIKDKVVAIQKLSISENGLYLFFEDIRTKYNDFKKYHTSYDNCIVLCEENKYVEARDFLIKLHPNDEKNIKECKDNDLEECIQLYQVNSETPIEWYENLLFKMLKMSVNLSNLKPNSNSQTASLNQESLSTQTKNPDNERVVSLLTAEKKELRDFVTWFKKNYDSFHVIKIELAQLFKEIEKKGYEI
jgi:hypothetical protein